MDVINLSTLEAQRALNPHRNVKTLTTWNHHPWHRPDHQARWTLWEEKLDISLFILFAIVKIINSLDRKVVVLLVPLLYAGELLEIFNLL